jgi:integrase
MAALRHVYHSARLDYNDPDLNSFPIPNDPFEYYAVPKSPVPRHRDIPMEVIQLMIDTRKQYGSRVRIALDAFLISFGLCGMNAIDMFTCAKPKKGLLVYNRTKTKNRRDDKSEMRVMIEPCIKKIMDEYKDKDRCFDFYKRYSSMESLHRALNAGLKIWAEKHKLDKFTFYSARHSWATIGAGKKCGISWDTISAGLCHVNPKRVDAIYINQDWELIWDANKKILGLFKWE